MTPDYSSVGRYFENICKSALIQHSLFEFWNKRAQHGSASAGVDHAREAVPLLRAEWHGARAFSNEAVLVLEREDEAGRRLWVRWKSSANTNERTFVGGCSAISYHAKEP